MTLRNREEAARVAEATQTNIEGRCQQIVREFFNAPSVGDVDGDGRADAEDGFKSEPSQFVHFDRHPPRGTPVSFLGGRNDDGHRAISIGKYASGAAKIRSSDFNGITKRYQAGIMGNGTIEEIAAAMGVNYHAWSETISGQKIPLPPAPTPAPAPTPTKTRVTVARYMLRRVENLLEAALQVANKQNKMARARKIRASLLAVGEAKKALPDR